MSLGPWQIVIIAILVVLLFGRGKISGLMGDVAKGIKSFKKGMAEDIDDEPAKKVDETGDAAIDVTPAKAEKKEA
ncbi:MAG: sec-independent protein translocase protein TatA [Paracoccaceae bacterium]|jgi:sec-independent protein translocase protein TatA